MNMIIKYDIGKSNILFDINTNVVYLCFDSFIEVTQASEKLFCEFYLEKK